MANYSPRFETFFYFLRLAKLGLKSHNSKGVYMKSLDHHQLLSTNKNK